MADNFKTIKCPACQKEMVKVFVPTAGINVDVCIEGCGGIYFDNRELKEFDEPHENIDEILKAIEGREFKPVNEDLPRTCPVCGAKMIKNFTSAKKTIQIDECYACGGKFLDHGELTKIRAEYRTEAERSKDVLNSLYNSVGLQIKALDEENAKLRANRSALQKLFDRLILG